MNKRFEFSSILKAFAFLLSLWALLLLGACDTGLDPTNPYDDETPAEDQAKSTVKGFVLLEGQAAGSQDGVTVTLEGVGQTLTTTSTEDGAFEFAASVVPGRVELRFVLQSYENGSIGPISVDVSETLDLPELRLLFKRAQLSGEVTIEGIDNEGVEISDYSGVTIMLRRKAKSATAKLMEDAEGEGASQLQESYSAISDSDGTYFLGGIPFGEYRMTAARDGYVGEGADINVGEDLVSAPLITLYSSIGALKIADGAEYTRVKTVPVVLQASGNIAIWKISEEREFSDETTISGEFGQDVEAKIVETDFTLSDGDGWKNLYAMYITQSGVESEISKDLIILDTTPPENGSVQIAAGDKYLTDEVVELSLQAADKYSGVVGMRVSLDGEMDDETVVDYALSTTVTLPVPENGDGVELEVAVAFVDGAGNGSETVTDTILFDNTPPQMGANAMLIDNGSSITPSTSVELYFDVVGASHMKISNDSGLGEATWQDYQEYVSRWTLANSDVEEEKTVYASFKDEAGNETAIINDSIVFNSKGSIMGVFTSIPPDLPNVYDGFTFSLDGQQIGSAFGQVSVNSETSAFELSEIPHGYYYGLRISNENFATIDIGPLQVEAGKATDLGEISCIYLLGDIAGSLSVEEGDYSGISFFLDGELVPNVTIDEQGTFELEDTLIGYYPYLELRKDGYASVSSALIQVESGQTANVGNLDLKLARGAVEGWAKLVGKTDHAGIVVRLEGSSYTTVTDSQGYFYKDEIVVAPYELNFSKDDFQVRYISAIVEADTTKAINTEELPLWLSPQVGDFMIEGGASYTNQLEVELELKYEDAVKIRVLEEEFAEGDAEPPFELISDLVASGDMTLDPDGLTMYYTYAFEEDEKTRAVLDGAKTLYVQFVAEVDLGVEESSEVFSASIMLDTQPPVFYEDSPAITINSGDEYTNSSLATLGFAVMDENGIELVYLSTNEIDWASQTYLPAISYILPAPESDGLKNVYAYFSDPAGNESVIASDDITLDTVKPALVGFEILSDYTDGLGNKYSSTGTVELAIEAQGASRMMLSNLVSFDGAVWEQYAENRAWSVPYLEGAHTIYIKFADEAGNILGEEADINDEFILDFSVPEAPQFVLTGLHVIHQTGNDYADHSAIQMQLSDIPAGVKIQVDTSISFNDEAIETGGGLLNLALEDNDGVQVVYARYVDMAGNVSIPAQKTVILDTQAPSNPAAEVQEGSPYNSRTVHLSLSAEDAYQMKIVEGESCTGGSWVLYSSSYEVESSTGSGDKTFSVMFRDKAENESTCVQVSFELDMDRPQVTRFEVEDLSGDGYTNSRSVSLSVAASDIGGVAEMRFTNAGSFSNESWEPFQSSKSWVLESGNGSKTVRLQVRDLAGNVNTPDSTATLILDQTAPSSVSLAISDTEGYSSVATVSVTVAASDNLTTDGNLRYYISNSPSFPGLDEYLDWPDDKRGLFTANWNLSDSDGLKTVYLRVTDQAGNVSEADDNTILDTQGPSGSVAYLQEGYYLKDVSANLIALSSGAELMYIEGDVIDTDSTLEWTAFQASTPIEIDPSGCEVGGLCQVVVTFKDNADWSDGPFTIDLVLDTDQPAGSVTINHGDAYTNSQAVTVNMNLSDATTELAYMRLSNTAVFSGEWEPYLESRGWVLPDSDQLHTVYVQVKDLAGNQKLFSANIQLDRNAPENVDMGFVVGGNVHLYEGVKFASDIAVQVLIEGEDDVTSNDDLRFYLSNSSSFLAIQAIDLSGREPASEVVDWNIESIDGLQSVYLRVMDLAGNVTDSSASIILDTEDPSGSMTILGDDPTSSSNVNIRFNASSDVKFIKLANGAAPDCDVLAGYVEYPSNSLIIGYDLQTAVSATVEVYACLRDRAARTAVVFDSVIVDKTPPTGNVVIRSSDPTNSATVTLEMTASSDVEKMAIANGDTLDCSNAIYEAFSSSRTWSLSAETGTQTVTVCLRDYAGNYNSAVIQDSVYLDLLSPNATLKIGDGSSPIKTQTVTLNFDFSADNPARAIGDNDTMMIKVVNGTDINCNDTTGWFARTDSLESYQLDSPSATDSYGESTVYVTACFKDAAGNVSTDTASVYLDTLPPIGTISLQGDYYRNADSLSGTVDISYSTDAEKMHVVVRTLNNPPNCAAIALVNYEAVADTASVSLIRNDIVETGIANYIFLCLLDSAGNYSTKRMADNCVVDTNKPNQPQIEIQGSDPTNDPYVDIAVSDMYSDIVSIALANGSIDCENAEYQYYTSLIPWTLEIEEGVRVVSACFKDHAGNVSDADIFDQVYLDITAPKVPTPLTPSNNSWSNMLSTAFIWTSETDVELYELTVMKSPESGSLSVVTTANTTYILALEEGQVYLWQVRGRDSIGNWSSYSPLNYFVVDSTPPVLGADPVLINGGDDYTRYTSADISLDVSGADYMRVACSGILSSTIPWVPYSSSYSCLLSDADGPKNVLVEFKDEAGNVTDETLVGDSIVDFILLDRTPPAPPVIVNVGKTVNLTQINLEIIGTCDDPIGCQGVAEIKGGQSYPDWTLMNSGSSWPINLRLNKTNVYSVRYIDNAGNTSSEEFVIYRHDNIAPDNPENVQVISDDKALRIKWDQLDTAANGDLGGYKIYYGYSDSSNLVDYNGNFANQGASPIDVGKANTFTLTGLMNDVPVYIAITSYDVTEETGPNESTGNKGNEGIPMELPLVLESEIVGQSGVADGIDDMVIDKGWVYTTSTYDGLKIYRTRDLINAPDAAEFGDEVTAFGSLDRAELRRSRIHKFKNYLYFFGQDGRTGMGVVDVSDPASPVYVNEVLKLYGGALDMYWDDFESGQFIYDAGVNNSHYAYGIVEFEGVTGLYLWRVNMNDSSNPSSENGRRFQIDASPIVGELEITSRYAIATCWDSDDSNYYFYRFDISDPTSIPAILVEDVEVPAFVRDMVTSYPYTFIAGKYGLYIVDENGVTQKAFQVDTSQIGGVAIAPGYAFVGYNEGSKVLRAISLDAPGFSLLEAGSWRQDSGSTEFWYKDMSSMGIEGNYLYASFKDGNSDGLRVWRISDPLRFEWEGQISSGTGNDFRGFAVNKDMIYGATSGSELAIYRVWDKESPEKILESDFGGDFRSSYRNTVIPFGANYLFVGSRLSGGFGGFVNYVDVLQGEEQVAYSNIAYSSNNWESYTYRAVNDAVVYGDSLIVANVYDGLDCMSIYDLRDLSQLTHVGNYGDGAACGSVDTNGGYIYATRRNPLSSPTRVETYRFLSADPLSGATPIDSTTHLSGWKGADVVVYADYILSSKDRTGSSGDSIRIYQGDVGWNQISSFFPYANDYHNFEWYGNFLFTPVGQTWDLSDLAAPEQYSSIGSGREVRVSGATVFYRDGALMGYSMKP